MSATPIKSEEIIPAEGRPLTGRMVLLWLIGFFMIVFAANGVMMHFAISTFSGIEEVNAYSEGLSYDKQIREEHAQEARGWSVDLSQRRINAATSEFTIQQKDSNGAALAGLEVELLLEHPADRRRDMRLVLMPTPSGDYRQSANVDAGQWDVVAQITQNGQQMFRSRNRIVIDDVGRGLSKP